MFFHIVKYRPVICCPDETKKALDFKGFLSMEKFKKLH